MTEIRVPDRRDMWIHMLLYPGHTLPTALAPILVAVGLAVRDGSFAALPALFAFIAGWLIQVGGVFTDNYENLVRHPDDREHPQLVTALRNGALTLAGLRAAIAACYLGALAAGAYLISVAGLPVLWIGLAAIAASLLYSAGPWPFGLAGLADPVFLLFFGAVSVSGGYVVQALPESLPWNAVALGLPVGALTTCILIIDDIRDREFDLEKGKRTVAVRWGLRWSRAEFLALMGAAYLAPIWAWGWLEFSATVLLPLATLPLAVATTRLVFRLERFEDLVPMTPRAARLLLAYSALLAAGVGMSD
ncbi:MAG: 1,4-dihydroxy-2-naphthoate octaprenyltransferase [Betaproteobacteria bacterium]|nr:1,4-dihydroxy-2-naphthoate octaprenyltransferase [Betaproteobacteria bacterium]